MISEIWTFGLENLFVRTREPFFSNLRTFGLKNLRTHEPSNLRTFGLMGCNLSVGTLISIKGLNIAAENLLTALSCFCGGALEFVFI